MPAGTEPIAVSWDGRTVPCAVLPACAAEALREAAWSRSLLGRLAAAWAQWAWALGLPRWLPAAAAGLAGVAWARWVRCAARSRSGRRPSGALGRRRSPCGDGP